MSTGIFISYRRDDSGHAAGRLVDRLSRTLPNEKIFIDVDNMLPGVDFRRVLSEKVATCEVVLALIGTRWLNAVDDTGSRRLDDPRDFVRIEIEAALNRDIPVIPVLIDRATMPREIDLPDSLKALSYRSAVRLSHEDFSSNADVLANTLADKILRPAAASGFVGSMVRSATKVIADLNTPNQDFVLGARGWIANTVRRERNLIELQLENDGDGHSIILELKFGRLRDRLLVDGKEDWFVILNPGSFSRAFKLERRTEQFELRVKGTAFGRIKQVELTVNGQLIFQQS